MADLQGVPSYPGVVNAKGCRYVRTNGVYPDVAVLTLVPQAAPVATQGTLALSFGATTVLLPNCRVDYTSLRVSQQGHVASLRLWDRRWRWQNAYVNGHWNVVYAGTTSIVSGTERTPQEMAAQCFEAMGESVYDVSALPNFDRPETRWSYKQAATALDELCSARGCDVSLGWDNVPRIVRKGFGQTLPSNDDVMNVAFGADVAEAPDTLRLVGGPSKFQVKFALVPMVEETDGSIVDAGLASYAPNLSFEVSSLSTFDVDVTTYGQAALSAAQKSAFRWYKVATLADGSLDMPVFGTLTSIEQVFPLENRLLISDTNGTPLRPIVGGVFFPEGAVGPVPSSSMNTSADTVLTTGFTLDRGNGLFKFDSPVFQRTSDGKWSPATLYAVATVSVYGEASPGTQFYSEPLRWNQFRVLGSLGNGERVIRREDIRSEYIATYTTAAPTVVDGVVDNSAQVVSESNVYLDAAALEYVTDESATVTYRGLYPFNTDGRVRQVGIYMTDNPTDAQTKTVVGVNSEFDPFVLKGAERRRIQAVKELQEGEQSARLSSLKDARRERGEE